MNIEQFLSKAVKVSSIVRNPTTNNWVVNFTNGRAVQSDINDLPYDALFAVKSESEKIFQLVHDDAIASAIAGVDQSDYISKDVFLWLDENASILVLLFEKNASYSDGKKSSFIVRYGIRENGYDDKMVYMCCQSQYFPLTHDGLQEAITCFVNRMNSGQAYKAK